MVRFYGNSLLSNPTPLPLPSVQKGINTGLGYGLCVFNVWMSMRKDVQLILRFCIEILK